MKKSYSNPMLTVVKIQTPTVLAVSVGEEFKTGDTVLSREFDYDDEEEYEEY